MLDGIIGLLIWFMSNFFGKKRCCRKPFLLGISLLLVFDWWAVDTWAYLLDSERRAHQQPRSNTMITLLTPVCFIIFCSVELKDKWTSMPIALLSFFLLAAFFYYWQYWFAIFYRSNSPTNGATWWCRRNRAATEFKRTIFGTKQQNIETGRKELRQGRSSRQTMLSR